MKVSLNDRADDGAVNEGDNVDRDVEHITGGAGGDTSPATRTANIIDGGGGGRDVIGSGAGGDVIVGILDGAGDDTVGCGGEVDNVQFDDGDIVDADCEFRNGGVRRRPARPDDRDRARTPSAAVVGVDAPVAWTQLDEVELFARPARRTVGRIRLDQETRTVRAAGAGCGCARQGALAGDTAGRTMTGEFVVRFSRVSRAARSPSRPPRQTTTVPVSRSARSAASASASPHRKRFVMHVQIVEFELQGVGRGEYEAFCDQLALAFAQLPGLIAKVWIIDGGIQPRRRHLHLDRPGRLRRTWPASCSPPPEPSRRSPTCAPADSTCSSVRPRSRAGCTSAAAA